MHSYIIIIFASITVFIVIASSYYKINTNEVNETMQNYIQMPYGYVRSGTDPLYFKRVDRYRRPYEDGFKFFKSYPYPHLSPRE